MSDENYGFGITIRYGNRSLEWRPTVGPPQADPMPLWNTHSRWEMALITLLLEEFRMYLKEQQGL